MREMKRWRAHPAVLLRSAVILQAAVTAFLSGGTGGPRLPMIRPSGSCTVPARFDPLIRLAKARIELEGEVTLEQMKAFWLDRGLKPHRARWLIKEAENEPRLRCPEWLEPKLNRLQTVFDGVDVNKLCSRFPALLLQDPRVTQERVETIRGLLDRVTVRTLATRAAHLLLLESEVVKSRFDALQASLPGVDVRKLCSKALTVLLEPDPSSLVEQCLAAIREELPAAANKPAEVLVANPLLLLTGRQEGQGKVGEAEDPASAIRERKALLQQQAHVANPAAMLISAPYLLTLPSSQLSSSIAALSDALPSTTPPVLPRALQACPRLLAIEGDTLASIFSSLRTELPGLNLTQVMLREPLLLPRLAGAFAPATQLVDISRRILQWQEAFSPFDMRAVFTKHPTLLAIDRQSAEAKLDALEAAILVSPSDRRGAEPAAEAGDATDMPQQLDRLAVLRKAPMVLKEDAAVLERRAVLLREVLGSRDLLELARLFPRLILKDFYRNLVPKAHFFARRYPPQSLGTLLRDFPQVFFYSTASIQTKAAKLDAALRPLGLNTTALITAFPSIVCLDVGKNIKLKVDCLCTCYPGEEMVSLIEQQPRVLIHGFGRISRVVHAAKLGLSAVEALRLVTLSWAELSEHPAYLQELGKQELASLTNMEASRGAALREALSKGMDRASLMKWEPPVEGYQGVFAEDDEEEQEEDEDGEDEKDSSPRPSKGGPGKGGPGKGSPGKPRRGIVIPLSRG